MWGLNGSIHALWICVFAIGATMATHIQFIRSEIIMIIELLGRFMRT